MGSRAAVRAAASSAAVRSVSAAIAGQIAAAYGPCGAARAAARPASRRERSASPSGPGGGGGMVGKEDAPRTTASAPEAGRASGWVGGAAPAAARAVLLHLLPTLLLRAVASLAGRVPGAASRRVGGGTSIGGQGGGGVIAARCLVVRVRHAAARLVVGRRAQSDRATIVVSTIALTHHELGFIARGGGLTVGRVGRRVPLRVGRAPPLQRSRERAVRVGAVGQGRRGSAGVVTSTPCPVPGSRGVSGAHSSAAGRGRAAVDGRGVVAALRLHRVASIARPPRVARRVGGGGRGGVATRGRRGGWVSGGDVVPRDGDGGGVAVAVFVGRAFLLSILLHRFRHARRVAIVHAVPAVAAGCGGAVRVVGVGGGGGGLARGRIGGVERRRGAAVVGCAVIIVAIPTFPAVFFSSIQLHVVRQVQVGRGRFDNRGWAPRAALCVVAVAVVVSFPIIHRGRVLLGRVLLLLLSTSVVFVAVTPFGSVILARAPLAARRVGGREWRRGRSILRCSTPLLWFILAIPQPGVHIVGFRADVPHLLVQSVVFFVVVVVIVSVIISVGRHVLRVALKILRHLHAFRLFFGGASLSIVLRFIRRWSIRPLRPQQLVLSLELVRDVLGPNPRAQPHAARVLKLAACIGVAVGVAVAGIGGGAEAVLAHAGEEGGTHKRELGCAREAGRGAGGGGGRRGAGGGEQGADGGQGGEGGVDCVEWSGGEGKKR